jgi:hypothetical protein
VLYRIALQFSKTNLLPNNPSIRASMNNLATILYSLNQFKDSEELFRDAINFYKANLMPNDPKIGNSMNDLATVLYRLNRLE